MSKKINLDELQQTAQTLKNYIDATINDRMNKLKIKTITQSEYDSLESKDPNTLYLITD
nr:MAG TPA: hypothetical protein [Caudoviricetes sp.]